MAIYVTSPFFLQITDTFVPSSRGRSTCNKVLQIRIKSFSRSSHETSNCGEKWDVSDLTWHGYGARQVGWSISETYDFYFFRFFNGVKNKSSKQQKHLVNERSQMKERLWHLTWPPFTNVVSRKATQPTGHKNQSANQRDLRLQVWLWGHTLTATGQLKEQKNVFSHLQLSSFGETATPALFAVHFSRLSFLFALRLWKNKLPCLFPHRSCHFNPRHTVRLPHEIQPQRAGPSAVLNIWTNHQLGDKHGHRPVIQSDLCVRHDLPRMSQVAGLWVIPYFYGYFKTAHPGEILSRLCNLSRITWNLGLH